MTTVASTEAKLGTAWKQGVVIVTVLSYSYLTRSQRQKAFQFYWNASYAFSLCNTSSIVYWVLVNLVLFKVKVVVIFKC